MLKPILIGSAASVWSKAASRLSTATAGASIARRNRLSVSSMSSLPLVSLWFVVPMPAPHILCGANRGMELFDGRIGEVVDVVAQRFHRYPDHHIQQLRSGIALIKKRLDIGIQEPSALVDNLAHKTAQCLGFGIL